MSLTRKIAHNTFIQIASRVVFMILGLLAVGIMTRYFGREGFGQYTTVTAFLQFFGIIVDFGLAVVIVQMISARPDETAKLTSNIFTFRLLTALILFAVAPLVVWLFPYPMIIKWGVAVMAAALFFTSLNQLLVGLFQRELKMIQVAVAENIGRLLAVMGLVVAVKLGYGLLPVMAFVSLGNFLTFLLLFYFSRRLVKIRLAFDWPVWREVFLKSWPIGLSIIFNLVYFKADTVILSLYRSQAEVGVYGATYKVLEMLSALPYLFMGLILPLLSIAWANRDQVGFLSIMQKSWDFLSLVTWPMVLGGIVLARPIMVLIAGEDFAPAAPVLQILLLATGLIYLSTIFNHAVVAMERQKKMLGGFLAVAIISLVGYFWLIPQYSYWAAAGLTVLAEFLILIISAAVVFKNIAGRLRFEVFGKAALGSVIMVLVLFGLQLMGWPLLPLILVGALVYVVLIYLLGGVEKGILKEVFGRSGE